MRLHCAIMLAFSISLSLGCSIRKCPLDGYEEPGADCSLKKPMTDSGHENCLFCAETNKTCTRMGCGHPEPGPQCKKLGVHYPNGVRCGYCLACLDNEDETEVVTEQCLLDGYEEPGAKCSLKKQIPGHANCLFCEEANQACTRMGCGHPEPGPQCKRVGVHYPNGVNCGYCLACLDNEDETEVVKEGCPLEGYEEPGADCPYKKQIPGHKNCLFCEDPNQACTRKGCGRPEPGPQCESVGVHYPNGVKCGYCLSCLDPIVEIMPVAGVR